MTEWGPLHVHSRYSSLDGTTAVESLVQRAADYNMPFMALTDHGNMAGAVTLYKECKAKGILPYPGIEGYLIDPNAEDQYHGKNDRYHFGLVARDLEGFRGLVGLSRIMHSRPRFNRFPRLTIGDLMQFGKDYGQHVILTTGCFFGLVQQKISTGDLKAAERAILTYAQFFPHTIVELQNHHIQHDDYMNDDLIGATLYTMACKLGLPVIATQDSHYLDRPDKVAHSLMKRMVYAGADDAFPGDSFHFASGDWVEEHYPAKVWASVMETVEHVVRLNKLNIPPLDEYKTHMPRMAKLPYRELAGLCRRALDQFTAQMSGRELAKYVQRLNEELSIIKDLGMANYFLLVQSVVQWCNRRKICVEARGSANGSLVCFMLGITQVDPIKWDLLVERFISRDRIKPPDIDLDIEDDRRLELIEYLKTKYPTTQIGTWAVLGASADDPTRGSVLVTYKSYLRNKEIQKALDTSRTKGEGYAIGTANYNRKYGHIESISDLKTVSKADWAALLKLSRMKTYKSYGVHAAGVLLGSDTLPIEDYVPTMLVASSDTNVSQFDMDVVELLGLLKLDVLGQASLSVMKRCQEMIGRDNPNDFTWIPENDAEACKILREGRQDNGIFHFEGWTKAKGGKEMGIRSTKDAVLATALYMPGSMDSGQTALFLRHRRNRHLTQEYLHPIYKAALLDTHGAVVFQEQPLKILRGLGMSIENINIMFKIVKDSGSGAVERNAERLTKLKEEFEKLCVNAGIDDLAQAWHLVTGFIAYGFNKAHATGYGLRSYRCAYLKAYYPMEFMAALLTVHGGKTKETIYAREARRIGIRLLPPDVNVSKDNWTLDRNARGIRKGLSSIKGIGPAAAQAIAAGAPYKNIDDLINRVAARSLSGGAQYIKTGVISGKLKDLNDAGALESLRPF